jgi:hypothetical protein
LEVCTCQVTRPKKLRGFFSLENSSPPQHFLPSSHFWLICPPHMPQKTAWKHLMEDLKFTLSALLWKMKMHQQRLLHGGAHQNNPLYQLSHSMLIAHILQQSGVSSNITIQCINLSLVNFLCNNLAFIHNSSLSGHKRTESTNCLLMLLNFTDHITCTCYFEAQSEKPSIASLYCTFEFLTSIGGYVFMWWVCLSFSNFIVIAILNLNSPFPGLHVWRQLQYACGLHWTSLNIFQ